MDGLDLLNLLARWFHILPAIVAVGGTAFVRFVLVPSQGILTDTDHIALHDALRARWSKIIAVCIALLLLSGLYNYWYIVTHTVAPLEHRWYHPLIGTKILLAIALFIIASLLTGRTAAAQRMRTNARFWLNVNLVLAVLIVCISGILRTADKKLVEATDPGEAPPWSQGTPE